MQGKWGAPSVPAAPVSVTQWEWVERPTSPCPSERTAAKPQPKFGLRREASATPLAAAASRRSGDGVQNARVSTLAANPASCPLEESAQLAGPTPMPGAQTSYLLTLNSNALVSQTGVGAANVRACSSAAIRFKLPAGERIAGGQRKLSLASLSASPIALVRGAWLAARAHRKTNQKRDSNMACAGLQRHQLGQAVHFLVEISSHSLFTKHGGVLTDPNAPPVGRDYCWYAVGKVARFERGRPPRRRPPALHERWGLEPYRSDTDKTRFHCRVDIFPDGTAVTYQQKINGFFTKPSTIGWRVSRKRPAKIWRLGWETKGVRDD
jgi:hypothetical protein